MVGVSCLRDRKSSKDLQKRLGVANIMDVLFVRQNLDGVAMLRK